MKLFLTGASGLVGAAVARIAARRGHEVIGVVGRATVAIPGLAQRHSLNLADENALTRAVLDAFPEAIINCAAISEPAVCDKEPVLSQALNVALPTALGRLAHHVNARYVHISSEQVFNGESEAPYRVEDAPSPINLYGEQKVASERAVLAAAPELAAVVRAPLLMGDSPGGQRGLHERLLADWAAGRTARLYTDEYRQPCTAENLAEVLVELIERPDFRGVFHWAGSELVSRFEIGRRIRDRFRLSEADAPIAAVTRAHTPEVARRRPARLPLDLAPLVGKLKTRPQTIAGQLQTLKVPSHVQSWFQARK